MLINRGGVLEGLKKEGSIRGTSLYGLSFCQGFEPAVNVAVLTRPEAVATESWHGYIKSLNKGIVGNVSLHAM